MTTCESVQAHLLNYLYELLEEDDQRAVESHLAGCERCQAALNATRGKQKLLATAAKKQFPQVRFNRPALNVPPPRKLAPSTWSVRTWVLAASILLAFGLLLPAGWFWHRMIGGSTRHLGKSWRLPFLSSRNVLTSCASTSEPSLRAPKQKCAKRTYPCTSSGKSSLPSGMKRSTTS